MTRAPFIAILVAFATVHPASAGEPASSPDEPIPKEFRDAAYGVWTRLAGSVEERLTAEALGRALMTCGGRAARRPSGTVIMPKGRFVVRADIATGELVAIAAAKPGRRRGKAAPWALATDRGYRAIAFVTRGAGERSRRFMLDDTGVHLRCGNIPKTLLPAPDKGADDDATAAAGSGPGG